MNLSEVLAAMVFTFNNLDLPEGPRASWRRQSPRVIRTWNWLNVTPLVITFN
jgi:hypothetical protein